ncbi:hypothetical protein RND81_13G049300 [Saponaria officinalis]|uniref:Uncharacterized protein n=1 Tax=Saponaria officinalis TaxID=3572 RepID=A0AAW1H472_SAPOF
MASLSSKSKPFNKSRWRAEIEFGSLSLSSHLTSPQFNHSLSISISHLPKSTSPRNFQMIFRFHDFINSSQRCSIDEILVFATLINQQSLHFFEFVSAARRKRMQTEARVGVVVEGGQRDGCTRKYVKVKQQQHAQIGTMSKLLDGGIDGAVIKTCNASLARLTILFQVKSEYLLHQYPKSWSRLSFAFMWAMLSALGLSNLRYSDAGSSRNIIIIGLSLFSSLSIPAYFQQYGVSPKSNVSVPSYFLPYVVASHGLVHTKFDEV